MPHTTLIGREAGECMYTLSSRAGVSGRFRGGLRLLSFVRRDLLMCFGEGVGESTRKRGWWVAAGHTFSHDDDIVFHSPYSHFIH